MAKQSFNNIKLGVFVLAGLLFLILLLYMIGKNRNLFGHTYVLKSRFSDVRGAVAGNNVRFSGISAGTVKKITILKDTLIEISMVMDAKMKKFIRKNAVASIATDGFVGNKVVNITPGKEDSPLAVEGDILPSKNLPSTDDMLQVLNKTNNNIAEITDDLKSTVKRINNSSALWNLLNDESVPANLRASVASIRAASAKAELLTGNFNTIITDIQHGKGSLGAIIHDSSFAINLNEAIRKIKSVGDEADKLGGEMSSFVSGIRNEVNNGKGALNALLKDTTLVNKLNSSLENIRKGTDGFNQNMEALKHSIFFRGYFRKLEKQHAKDAE
jgi:phospholipid/cholesterol/gamma-HCH transport system substrate-binding protein